jgi:hypothetical protein
MELTFQVDSPSFLNGIKAKPSLFVTNDFWGFNATRAPAMGSLEMLSITFTGMVFCACINALEKITVARKNNFFITVFVLCLMVIAIKRVYKNRKGENMCSGLPCAGITLIRFNGFNLSIGNCCLSTPGTKNKIRFFCTK